MIFKSTTSRVRKTLLSFALIFFCGALSNCSALSPLNLGNGQNSGDSHEETRNPPNTEAPPSGGDSILVAGGGNCPSGQCTEESHGTRDPHSGEDSEPVKGGGGGDLAANNSNSQPTQTLEGTDPDPSDNNVKPNPCPPGVDCNRVKRDSREGLKRPEIEMTTDADVLTSLNKSDQIPSSFFLNQGLTSH